MSGRCTLRPQLHHHTHGPGRDGAGGRGGSQGHVQPAGADASPMGTGATLPADPGRPCPLPARQPRVLLADTHTPDAEPHAKMARPLAAGHLWGPLSPQHPLGPGACLGQGRPVPSEVEAPTPQLAGPHTGPHGPSVHAPWGRCRGGSTKGLGVGPWQRPQAPATQDRGTGTGHGGTPEPASPGKDTVLVPLPVFGGAWHVQQDQLGVLGLAKDDAVELHGRVHPPDVRLVPAGKAVPLSLPSPPRPSRPSGSL